MRVTKREIVLIQIKWFKNCTLLGGRLLFIYYHQPLPFAHEEDWILSGSDLLESWWWLWALLWMLPFLWMQRLDTICLEWTQPARWNNYLNKRVKLLMTVYVTNDQKLNKNFNATKKKTVPCWKTTMSVFKHNYYLQNKSNLFLCKVSSKDSFQNSKCRAAFRCSTPSRQRWLQIKIKWKVNGDILLNLIIKKKKKGMRTERNRISV